MAERGYFLSEKDRRALNTLLKQHQQTPPTRTAFLDKTQPDYKMPEMYVAKPRDASGITALTEAGTGNYDEPGSGVCNVYKVWDNSGVYELHPVNGPEKMVFNLSTAEISQDHWIQIFRDKFGQWVIVNPPTVADDEQEVITDVRYDADTHTWEKRVRTLIGQWKDGADTGTGTQGWETILELTSKEVVTDVEDATSSLTQDTAIVYVAEVGTGTTGEIIEIAGTCP